MNNSNKKENLVMISFEDLRKSFMSCLGDLRHEGLILDNCNSKIILTKEGYKEAVRTCILQTGIKETLFEMKRLGLLSEFDLDVLDSSRRL